MQAFPISVKSSTVLEVLTSKKSYPQAIVMHQHNPMPLLFSMLASTHSVTSSTSVWIFVSPVQGLSSSISQLRELHLRKQGDSGLEVGNEHSEGASSISVFQSAAQLSSGVETDAAASGDQLKLFPLHGLQVAKTRHVIEAVEKTSFKDLLKSEHVSVSRTTRLFQARQSVRIYFESSANEPCLKYADLSSDSSCTCSV
uniref:Uncharacterized protein n=1 Tax=Physcomitrium patens TaxID=3218 RepID=A0A7I4AW07_PHYPA